MNFAKKKKLFCKSQSAIEFITLASFMFLIVLGFIAVISTNVLRAKDEGNKKVAQDIADFAYREIDLAKSVNNGYIRTFILPETVNGVTYTISITDNRELAVSYLDNEFVRFLPANVTGNISKGINVIIKKNDIVYLNSTQVELPQPLLELLMKNNGTDMISFGKNGNVILKGILNTNSNPIESSADEFIVKNNVGTIVAIINLDTGNMYIRGNLLENQLSLNPVSNSNFIIKDNSGNVIDYIDDSGNFLLKGTITQNGNP
ncbi:MAG TPA: hypothetical protein VJJ52_06405 [Candidatus Nanoarchaeia archaeon]|nr:hypothetical protein [Candidatus Nanoarchaeia archaeon]